MKPMFNLIFCSVYFYAIRFQSRHSPRGNILKIKFTFKYDALISSSIKLKVFLFLTCSLNAFFLFRPVLICRHYFSV